MLQCGTRSDAIAIDAPPALVLCLLTVDGYRSSTPQKEPSMGARSHKNQFIKALKAFPHEKASFTQLADKLGDKWTPEQVEAKARQFDADQRREAGSAVLRQ